MKYKQALIDDAEGTCWGLSVPEDVELDEQGRIVDPANVIEEDSVIVAVEAGTGPAGEITEIPNPFEVAEADAAIKEGGGNGHTPQEKTFHNPPPHTGAFTVRYAEEGIVLTHRKSLGDFLA